MQPFLNPSKHHETHSFNPNVAVMLSMEKAVILKELYNLSSYKLAHGQLKKGLPFVYFSATALEKKMPYLNAKSIGRWLREMESDGWISSAIVNRMKLDKTKSYTPNFKRYDDATMGKKWTIAQNEQWKGFIDATIAQNEQWATQNGQSVTQNEDTITFSNTTLSDSHTEGVSDFSKKETPQPPTVAAGPEELQQAADGLPEDERRIDEAVQRVRAYFRTYPAMVERCREAAKQPKLTNAQIIDEIKKWVRHHAEEFYFLANIEKKVSKSFISWMGSPYRKFDQRKPAAANPTGAVYSPPRYNPKRVSENPALQKIIREASKKATA